MSPVMRGQWAELMGPGLVMRTFTYMRHPEFFRRINVVKTSNRAYEDDYATGGFGPLAKKAELAKTIMDEPFKIGGVRFIHETFALGFEISKEMKDDAMYPVMQDLAGELGTSSYWTMELYGHDVYNNGFTTAKYVGRDSKALFAVDHPVQGVPGGIAANRPAADTDLSESALEAALLSYELQQNERGMPIMLRPSILLIHPSNRLIAKTLFDVALSPTNLTDANTNRLQGEIDGYLSDPWLTDADAWFLTSTPAQMGDGGPRMYIRENPDTTTWDDPNADGSFHKIRQRHSNGFADWRGTYGSPGA